MGANRGTGVNHGTHAWTDANIAWLRKNAAGRSLAEITERFNRRFWREVAVGVGTVRQRMHQHGIRSGVDRRFKPGVQNAPKLKKGEYWAGCESGWFKKRNRPHNAVPVGTLSDTCQRQYGYLAVKIGEPNEWLPLHRAIWEFINGPVPAGCMVIFGDRDKYNLSPSNLVCVTAAQLAVMNQCKLIYNDAELTRVGALAASVKMASYRRKRELKTKKRSVRK
ncbi:hypothetical protein R80B4_00939 [Fibrobacteres bacterium R8-0-B4]